MTTNDAISCLLNFTKTVQKRRSSPDSHMATFCVSPNPPHLSPLRMVWTYPMVKTACCTQIRPFLSIPNNDAAALRFTQSCPNGPPTPFHICDHMLQCFICTICCFLSKLRSIRDILIGYHSTQRSNFARKKPPVSRLFPPSPPLFVFQNLYSISVTTNKTLYTNARVHHGDSVQSTE